jgi:hypothetical protein
MGIAGANLRVRTKAESAIARVSSGGAIHGSNPCAAANRSDLDFDAVVGVVSGYFLVHFLMEETRSIR